MCLKRQKSIHVINGSGCIVGDVLNSYFFGDVFELLFFASVMYLEENKFGDCPSICKLIK